MRACSGAYQVWPLHSTLLRSVANFENAMLQQTLDALGIRKSRTTAYHPEGDGMVEWFNRMLLYSC